MFPLLKLFYYLSFIEISGYSRYPGTPNSFPSTIENDERHRKECFFVFPRFYRFLWYSIIHQKLAVKNDKNFFFLHCRLECLLMNIKIPKMSNRFILIFFLHSIPFISFEQGIRCDQNKKIYRLCDVSIPFISFEQWIHGESPSLRIDAMKSQSLSSLSSREYFSTTLRRYM